MKEMKKMIRAMMETKSQRKRINRKLREKEMSALTKGMAVATLGEMAKRCQQTQRKKKKRTRRPRNAGSGEIVVRRKELLAEFKTAAEGGDILKKFALIPKTMTWLKTLAKAFEKYQWLSVKAMWKPAVGTVVGGLVTLGMRWDEADQDPASRTAIVALTPNRTHAVWEDGERLPLIIPTDKLQTRKWYIVGGKGSDGGPGQIEIGVSTSEKGILMGELWVEYTIRMSGTQE